MGLTGTKIKQQWNFEKSGKQKTMKGLETWERKRTKTTPNQSPHPESESNEQNSAVQKLSLTCRTRGKIGKYIGGLRIHTKRFQENFKKHSPENTAKNT